MKKNLTKIFIIPAILLTLSACDFAGNGKSGSSSSGSSSSGGNTPAGNVEIGQTDNVCLKNSDAYNEFWNIASNIKIKLDFYDGVLEAIDKYDQSIYQDYYFPCDVTFTINGVETKFTEVGARRKGNLSKGDDFRNGLINYKLSFQETFDEDFYKNNDGGKYYKSWTSSDPEYVTRENRTFLDMEKLDLKWNRNYDQTNLRQSYANYCLRNSNIITCNNTIGEVSIYNNGSYNNVTATYDIIESIDKVMIKRWFSKAQSKGDLYKAVYNATGPATFEISSCLSQNSSGYVINTSKVGVEDPETNYAPIYSLKTNKKTSTHADFINFVKTINTDKSSGEEFESTLNSLLDVNYTARYMAVSYAIGDPDDLRNNYNNSFIYFEPTTHKAYLIPYDHDRVMGITEGYSGSLLPSRDFTSTKADGYGGGNMQKNPLYWRMVINDSSQGLGKTYPIVPSALAACKAAIYAVRDGDLFKPASFDAYAAKSPYAGGNSSSTSDKNPTSYASYYSNLIDKINNDSRL